MLNVLVCICANLFRVYLIRRYILIFVEKDNVSIKAEWIAYSLFYLINTGLYLGFRVNWINLLCNIVGIGIIVFLYTHMSKLILFIVSSFFGINMLCEMITILLFVDYKNGEGFNQLYFAMSIMIFFACVISAERIVNYQHNEISVQKMPLILVPLSSVILICLQLYTETTTYQGIIITSIGLLVINFLTLYLYNRVLEGLTKQYENELLKQKVQIYANQLEVIMQSDEKLRDLRHDLKHRVNELGALAKQQNNDMILNYLNDMQDFVKNPKEYVTSGNVEIDSVLNYLLQRAKEELNAVNIKVVLPDDMKHSFDMNVIMANLLENAIEAAEKSEEKRLKVNIRYEKGVLRIEIKNSFNNELLKEKGKLKTTKPNKEQHGIGLSNVTRMVEKYDGMINVSTDNNYFCVKVILYI